ncbi:type II secretion system F family protein [Glycomyces albus]
MNALTWPLAIGVGLGLTTVLDALWPRPNRDQPTDHDLAPASLALARARAWTAVHALRLAVAAIAGLVVWWWTGGWIADTIGAALLVFFAPVIFGDAKALKADAERSIAVAAWTESVRSAMTGSAGLEQALIASATFPPPGLEAPTRDLAAAMRAGQPVDAALARFGLVVDDEIGDRVVFALTRAWRRGGNLTGVLGRLASRARERARAKERINVARTSVRTSLRHLTVVSVLLLFGLSVINPILGEAFDTTGGQLLLFAADALWAVGVIALVRLSQWKKPPRLLAVDTEART